MLQAACSIRAYASRHRLHASGVDGSGMARSNVACDELLACPRRCVRVVDIEVGVDALAGLPA
jgi:hypothetical protein